jgi:hypothetical protein
MFSKAGLAWAGGWLCVGVASSLAEAADKPFGHDPSVAADAKNGNLSVREVDVRVSTIQYDTTLVRTFNSRTAFKGMFGNGWCSDYETTVLPLPEGSVALVTCGAGQVDVFGPRGKLEALARSTADDLAKTLVKSGFAGSDQQQDLARLLASDPTARARAAQSAGLAIVREPGIRLYENGRGPRFVDVLSDGYRLVSTKDAETRLFDSNGRLMSIESSRGGKLRFDYARGRLIKIENSSGPGASFRYNDSNLLSEADIATNKFTYTYSNGRLTRVGAGKEAILYEYDASGHLTKRTTSENAIAMEYSSDGLISRVVNNKECDDKLSFDLGDLPSGRYVAHRERRCAKEGPSAPADATAYKYEFRLNTSGTRRLLTRSVVTDGTQSVDVRYDPIFQLPSVIVKNGSKTEYSFDSIGRVTKVRLPSQIVDLQYDDVCSKITSVRQEIHSDDPNKQIRVLNNRFTYNGTCDLVEAEGDEGKISLSYNKKGAISAVVDSHGDTVFITYDAQTGKPAVIESAKGSIQVTYDTNGEIRSVQSDSGPEVAMKVASKFNVLLDAIGPANITDGLSNDSELGKNCACSVDRLLPDLSANVFKNFKGLTSWR